MSATVIVLTDEQTADGFRLSGVETVSAGDAATAHKELKRLLQEERIGIIAINEDWMESVDERTREYIDSLYRPIVVAIPSISAPEAGEDRGSRLARLIRRAVGFEIKLGGEEQGDGGK